MNIELIKKVLKNECNYKKMFCDSIVTENYTRFYDDKLKDMWDQNYTELHVELTPEIFEEIKQYKINRNESHIQITSFEPIEWLKEEGFDVGCTLVMVAEKLKVNPLKIQNITFKNTKDNPEIINDILNLELKYYGELWGNDFGARNIYRHFAEMMKRDNYYYLACYHNNKNVGQCYAFYSDGVVVIDGLIIEESYRNLNIASNMILLIKNTYNCPIYLHAYEDESAKEMYEKIGFKTIYKEYDHLLVDKKSE